MERGLIDTGVVRQLDLVDDDDVGKREQRGSGGDRRRCVEQDETSAGHNLEHGASKNLEVNQYALAHGLYALTNVANLDRMPANGGVAMVAPMKVTGGSAAPVRILALVR